MSPKPPIANGRLDIVSNMNKLVLRTQVYLEPAIAVAFLALWAVAETRRSRPCGPVGIGSSDSGPTMPPTGCSFVEHLKLLRTRILQPIPFEPIQII